MGTAYNDSVPVLHIVSENERTLRGKSRGFFHDIGDQFGVFRSAADLLVSAKSPLIWAGGGVSAAGLRVTNLREVGSALRQALDLNRPAILEVPNRFLPPGYGSFGQGK
jgi:thiamine pyrophosphate-dependent acetolactate synthase large subunit-like protein